MKRINEMTYPKIKYYGTLVAIGLGAVWAGLWCAMVFVFDKLGKREEG